MVPARSHKVSRVSWYSGFRLVNLCFAYGAFTLFGWSSQGHSATLVKSILRSEPRNARIPVWALPVSLAATPGIDVSFSSSGYLDVSVHRVPHIQLCIHCMLTFLPGFPIRKSVDITSVCDSPQLIAAYHVLHRLLVPRHPPCALISLNVCHVFSLPNS